MILSNVEYIELSKSTTDSGEMLLEMASNPTTSEKPTVT